MQVKCGLSMELGDRDLVQFGLVDLDLQTIAAGVESSAVWLCSFVPAVVAKVARCSFAGSLRVAVVAVEVGQRHGSSVQVDRP